MTNAVSERLPTNDDARLAWHTEQPAAVLRALGTTDAGLSSNEAAARLATYGPNRLPQQPPPAIWQILLHQFQSPLIYILLVAALVSVALDHLIDAVFIFAVLLLNAVIGGYQEWRAEQSTRALQRLLHIRATVVRDGEAIEIDAEQVVPGDIVWLESGNRVPADLRLLVAQGLEIDESLLTGESLPVHKDPLWEGKPEAGVGDRRNMAHAGSIVSRGRGKGLVVGTGSATVIGQLALDVGGATGGKPPLLLRLERFTRTIALWVLVAGVVVALVGVFLRGQTVSDMFLFAVALAVSAIPEGLPVALTVALSVATARMASRNVIVRRLAAVEGLGSCTLVASDKTGTLTCNELTVCGVALPSGTMLTVTGEGFVPEGEVLANGQAIGVKEVLGLEDLVRAAVLCNEADLHRREVVWAWRGDPTDVALLTLAGKLGWWREPTLDRHKPLGQVPFEPERRYAVSYHQTPVGPRAFVKGAPERVIPMCSPLAPEQRAACGKQAEQMAERGYRVLALAEGPMPDAVAGGDTTLEPDGLTFLGLVGMIDPPRPGVAQAVRSCQEAGVTVCMVTGDHPSTALAIARDLGLADKAEQVISGDELARRSPRELEALMDTVRVFARLSPRQKLELVEAARRAGHFVAVTGDGVNDAPALRSANIGVAMGKSGTDVAREASDLVLTDDNFATIVAGVEEGRIAYDNVRKVIYLLISTGAAEVFLVLLALVAGLPLPLLAVQFLWLNLVTNGIQDVALAFEPGEGDALSRRPRPTNEPIFNRLMIERTVVAAVVIGGVSFAAFSWMLSAGWKEESARNALLLLLVLFENIHIGNCRSETRSAFELSPLRSPILLIGTVVAQLLHISMMYLAIGQTLLRTEPVSFTTWLTLLGLALTVLVAMELHKWTWRARYGADK